MSIKDPVGEARQKAMGETKEPKGNAPPVPPPAAAPPPPVPEETPEAAPAETEARFKEGDKVSSLDTRRPPGVITGPPTPERFVYTVTPDDGSDAYMESEGQLQPFVEEPMNDETIAPAAMAELLGLEAGKATMGECNAAIQMRAKALDKETLEAKGAALDAAGVHATLKGLVSGSLVRAEGEDWSAAAERAKGEMPEAFKAEVVEAKSKGKMDDDEDEKKKEEAKKAKGDAPVVPIVPKVVPVIPAGAGAPDRTDKKITKPQGTDNDRTQAIAQARMGKFN